jgi:hypothetical protein
VPVLDVLHRDIKPENVLLEEGRAFTALKPYRWRWHTA